MKSVLFICNLTILFLGCSNVALDTFYCVAAQNDAYCPVKKILTCKNVHDLKCTPKIWHGIDSLEVPPTLLSEKRADGLRMDLLITPAGEI